MKFSKLIKKYFKSSEEVISMLLGLVIVIVVTVMMFNFIQKRKGSVTIPGITDISITSEDFVEKGNDKENAYVVLKNDSLWKIAEAKYNDGYAWTEIAKANNLDKPHSIEIGQKLVLPKIEKKEMVVVDSKIEKTIPTGEYKVEMNDSLWKIALRTYGDGYQWTRIWQENRSKLNSPGQLEIGMMLTIPSLK